MLEENRSALSSVFAPLATISCPLALAGALLSPAPADALTANVTLAWDPSSDSQNVSVCAYRIEAEGGTIGAGQQKLDVPVSAQQGYTFPVTFSGWNLVKFKVKAGGSINGGPCFTPTSAGSNVVRVTPLNYRDFSCTPNSWESGNSDADGNDKGPGLNDEAESCVTKTDPSARDTDGNGISDWEEYRRFEEQVGTMSWANTNFRYYPDYNTNCLNNYADDDCDHDGETDAQELANGTNPTDPTSRMAWNSPLKAFSMIAKSDLPKELGSSATSISGTPSRHGGGNDDKKEREIVAIATRYANEKEGVDFSPTPC